MRFRPRLASGTDIDTGAGGNTIWTNGAEPRKDRNLALFRNPLRSRGSESDTIDLDRPSEELDTQTETETAVTAQPAAPQASGATQVDPDAAGEISPTLLEKFTGYRPELQLRMHQYFEASCDRNPGAIALNWEGGNATYQELDAAANQIAHYLHAHYDPHPGSRIGLLIPRSPSLYQALLGIQKTGSAWVPIDPDAPAERVGYIADDASLDLVLTLSTMEDSLEEVSVPAVRLDELADELAAQPTTRPELDLEGDPTAYVIYTSGSSGRPKGVDIAQSSICNFIQNITEVYDVQPTDRVYQGMMIAFDFAIEEVWPTWAAGATLVIGPNDGRRVGAGLTTYLEEHGVTLLYCVPTVLSTVERDIPAIRAIYVGGEACPAELVERWGPGRRMLNTYGPTEATVTCTWGVLLPGRPVTIGVPVPTATAFVLDPDTHLPVEEGEVGELAIGGPGVANGYLNRPDLTADKFIQHPTLPEEGRIYRTGDLARIQPDGEIVYLGRADAEVKIRGHRVDLGEIESVLMRDEQVKTAAVKHITGGYDDIAGYFVTVAPVDEAGRDEIIHRLHASARETLPPYMVPSFLEQIDEIPMSPAGKVERKALPDPSTSRLVAGSEDLTPPATQTEEWVAGIWAGLFGFSPEQLSVTAHFFNDLGGHSLVAANATSKLRSDSRGAAMSVIDLYNNPTVRDLAAWLDEHNDPNAVAAEAVEVERGPRASGLKIAAFGAAQGLFVFLLVLIGMLPIAGVYWWYSGVPSAWMLRDIILTFPIIYLAERWVLPLVVARTAGAGLKPGRYPLYGMEHLRVWLTGKAFQLSPMNNLAGSPYAASYLRAAGADIGDNCFIGSQHVPLPTMLKMGDHATIGYASHLQGYYMADGWLQIAPVEIGHGATVAANCVLRGPCVMEPNSILREQSAPSHGAVIPAGEVWQGSPAARLGGLNDPVYGVMAACEKAPEEWPKGSKTRFLLGLFALEFLPLLAMLPVLVIVWWVLLQATEGWALVVTALTGPVFVLSACGMILGLRRFGLTETPVGIHHVRSILGLEKWFADKLLESSLALTNTLYSTLYTAPWLRRLGAKIGRRAEVSTIANIDPDLLRLGDESFVADMASVGSAVYCNGHVAFRPTTVGKRAFVGNAAFLPSGSRMGDNSLLGVGSVPPVEGVQAGTSWLGNPPIFLPNREIYDEFGEEETFKPKRSQVVARYIIEGLRIVLPASILGLSTFFTLAATSRLAQNGAGLLQLVFAVPTIALGMSLMVVLLVALMKWVMMGKYRPRVEPLWSMFVRRSEFVTGVFEASAVPALLQMLTGTPMLGALLRLYGVKVGKRSLIDTTYVTEFDLVHIGDEVEVGPEVSLQTHLFEDRVMKMSIVSLGDKTSLGTRSVVLYDTEVGEGVALSPLSLVMKGESLPDKTTWGGIPAQPIQRPQYLTQEESV